ncbi:helix-turn-helix domain-containing protein [Halorarum salinum]|uniref:Helix-turn-helix domain-containing protein n=1 Tax=Halorarum salinum TaxID=2743089 RepID=A0A7D5QJB6_9EURY|nr:helix-turn-helix domain-containing protein [Halobaculum salinum]QLG63624.1 helix-turn-helix domain-containing protein [Halobaculum salinum]
MSESYIAEITVTHPDLPLAPTIDAVSDVTVELESQPLSDPQAPTLFYSVKGPDFGAFESALADDRTVREWHVPVSIAECRVYRIRFRPCVKVLTPKTIDLGVRVLSATNAERGWTFRLHSPDKAKLGAYWEYCRGEGVRFEINKLYSTGAMTELPDGRSSTAGLTDRQREVARTATRMGYYETDGASAEEVAAELDISPSTLSTHLRRATAKVFGQLFRED